MTDPGEAPADTAPGTPAPAPAEIPAPGQQESPAPTPDGEPPPPDRPALPPPTSWGLPEAKAPIGPAPGWAYAGFWRRAVAMFIDGIVLTILSYAILIPIILMAVTPADMTLLRDVNRYTIDPVTGAPVASPEVVAAVGHIVAQLFLGLGIVFLVQGAYFVILWSLRGASLGQLILGVEIRNEGDGRRIGFWRSCLRYIGFLISGWVLLLGFIWVAVDARKQGWHDKIAGTLVVRRLD